MFIVANVFTGRGLNTCEILIYLSCKVLAHQSYEIFVLLKPTGDVSGVTYMRRMFHQAYKFNQDLASWDISLCTDFYRTFYHTNEFDGNLANWVFKDGAYVHRMFEYAYSFTVRME